VKTSLYDVDVKDFEIARNIISKFSMCSQYDNGKCYISKFVILKIRWQII